MKILILKNSILILKINPKTDIAISKFIFFYSLFGFKTQTIQFDLNKLNAVQIIKFYKKLAIDWTTKYRI